MTRIQEEEVQQYAVNIAIRSSLKSTLHIWRPPPWQTLTADPLASGRRGGTAQ